MGRKNPNKKHHNAPFELGKHHHQPLVSFHSSGSFIINAERNFEITWFKIVGNKFGDNLIFNVIPIQWFLYGIPLRFALNPQQWTIYLMDEQVISVPIAHWHSCLQSSDSSLGIHATLQLQASERSPSRTLKTNQPQHISCCGLTKSS